MAQVEEPLGYLGAEYLFEQLTALVTQAALPVIEGRDLPRDGLRFVIEHATEDVKHATFIKHLILDVVTRYPHSAPAMLRCFDYFHAVYPLPVWDEAYVRAQSRRVDTPRRMTARQGLVPVSGDANRGRTPRCSAGRRDAIRNLIAFCSVIQTPQASGMPTKAQNAAAPASRPPLPMP